MKVLNNLLVVDPIKPEEVTKSGIIIAEYAPQSKFEREIYPNKGTIVAMDDTLKDEFAVGEIIHFQRWGATEYEWEGKPALFINPKDVLAKEV
jgi:co-chaperonin GroES (HSP10)